MTTPYLQIDGLRAGYGKAEVLKDIHLQADRGSVMTVIGPNGAGKSTLLNAMMGVIPSSGRVVCGGEDLGRLTLEGRVRRGVSLVPETRALFASMAVEDNLRLGTYRFGRGQAERRHARLERVYGLFPRLKERRSQQAGTLSGGERQMLAVGRALMGEPDVLLLDEPSLGLAPLVVREIFSIISDLRQTGVTIVLVEQNAKAALDIADYGYVLETGEVSLHGPAKELAQDGRIVETYLGSA